MDIRLSRRSVLTMASVATGSLLFDAVAWAASPAAHILTLRTPEGRNVSVTMWRGAGRRRGIIAFSHGALSAPSKYLALIEPWAAAGYDVLAPLHVDSTEHPDTKKYVGFMSWRARIEDMRALSRHIGKDYIAVGHSYGGLVALTLGGAAAVVPEGLTGPLGDRRVKAVVAFSPPGPAKGLVDAAGYATLGVPALIQTGDRDVPPGAPETPDAWRTHLAAYDAAAAGGERYALVLEGVDHYFGGGICRLDLPGPRQSAQLETASGLSLLFLDAFGRHDRKARAMLDARLTGAGQARLARK